MATLAKNGNFILTYNDSKVNCYAVYHISPCSPSGDLKLSTMVAQSSIFTPKIKSYFTPSQVKHAVAKIHGVKQVAKKFKA